MAFFFSVQNTIEITTVAHGFKFECKRRKTKKDGENETNDFKTDLCFGRMGIGFPFHFPTLRFGEDKKFKLENLTKTV